jgi:hypothetical protein
VATSVIRVPGFKVWRYGENAPEEAEGFWYHEIAARFPEAIPKDSRGHPRWQFGGWERFYLAPDPTTWYLVRTPGERRGPFDTKRSALRSLGEESASRLDTGLYEVGEWKIGRRKTLEARGFWVYNAPEKEEALK